MAGYRGAAFGISQPPANAQQVGQSLMGQAQGQGMPGQAAPGMMPTLGIPSLLDDGMHSQASTDAALAEAQRRLQGSPERNAHSTVSPMVAWQLASLGIPKIEIDLMNLASGQQDDDSDDRMGRDTDGDLD